MAKKSQWTIDTLKTYLLALLDESDKRYTQRFQSQETAILKSEVATEKRFEGVNEFRSALSDKERSLMPRPEFEALHKTVLDGLDGLSKRIILLEGVKTGNKEGWGFTVGVIGLILSLLSIGSLIVIYGRKF